jgi:iron complex outermembrane receptor protein
MAGRSVALGLVGIVLACPCIAQSQTPGGDVHRFSIPAEPLGEALSQLAQQAGLQVMTPAKLVDGVRSHELQGAFSADEALRRLLADTGLVFTFVNSHTVSVNASQGQAAEAAHVKSPPESSKRSNDKSAPVAGDVRDGNPNYIEGSEVAKPSLWTRIVRFFGGNKPEPKPNFSTSSAAKIVALCGSVAAAGTVCAQQAPVPAATEIGTEMQEIVVTAEKVAEPLSKTPIALDAFSGNELQSRGVVSISDLQNLEPELNVGQSAAGANISLRGVSSTDVTSKGNQDIAFNVDGIYNGRPREQGLAFFDVDRVEVLRGPQGTLYGHSATGGAINVITNKPQDTFSISTSFELGDFNTRRATGVINVPLSSTLDVRIAANFNSRDGYLNPVLGNTYTLSTSERALNDEDNHTVRSSVLWTPADAVSLLATYTVGQIGGAGSDYGALYDRYTETGSAARAVYYNPMGTAVDDTFRDLNAELNVDMGPVHLTYAGAYDRYEAHDNDNASTFDPYAGGSYTWRNYQGDYTTDSHELRFSNSTPGFVDWVAGANYYREFLMEHDQNWATYVAPSPANNCYSFAPNLLYGCNNPNPIIVGPSEHKSEGVFGQANLHLTDALKLTLGARYSHDSMFRNATVDGGGGQPLTCYPPNDCVNGGEPDVGSESSSKVTWRVGLDYQLTTNQMVYVYVATGYKPGGFNDPGYGQTKTTTYGPENLTAYEIGYKGRILPNVQLSSDVYYYDFSKEQVTAAQFFGFGTAGPIVLIYTKVAPATLYGWENTLHYSISQTDMIDATLALERAYYGDLNVGFIASQPVDWTGKSLDNVPRASGTLAYEHRYFLPDSGYISARIQSKISGSYYESDLAGTGNVSPFGASYTVLPAQYQQASYHRSDLTIGYTSGSGKYDVYGYVRNIENKLQMTSVPQNLAFRSVSPDAVSVVTTAPRTLGVHIDAKF